MLVAFVTFGIGLFIGPNGVNVSVTVLRANVKVKFTLQQATKAQRWSRGIALLFLQPWR